MKLNKLTKDNLINLYINENKSLGDIAALYSVSRTAIYKKLKKYNIKQRSKSEARIEAQKQAKLSQQFFDINENFFSNWSPEMAYVLGLIITDGCISRTGTVSLCMNDKDLLDKVKKVMGSAHKITPSKHQRGLYIFHFARENMVKDLKNLGVEPKKSLIVKFPEVPQAYLPNFIRGVFDGDGSVLFKKGSRYFPLVTKFFSGSKDFIEKLEVKLHELGMPRRTIYQQKTKNGLYYTIVYAHKDSQNLFRILYEDTQNGLFMERKYKRFLEGFKKGLEGGELYGERVRGVVQAT
jgi:predicted DNA-binding protein YlxM (UPF0122 family)